MPSPLMRERPGDGQNYSAPLAILECVVERVTFHNTENGYSVVKVTPAESEVKGKGEKTKGKFVKDDVITVLGNFTNPTVGESLRLHGQWIKHPQYGSQFKLERYETLRPATAAAIEKYLGSGMVKGIGPQMAKRIVAKFGEDALNVIENTPKKLTHVSGIGEKRIDMIKAAWDEQRAVRDIMLFLQGHGVTPTFAVKIYRHYKERAIEVVENNPYQLASDIWGVGFKSADKIAQNIGIAPDAPARLEAGLVYVLNQEMESGGHCFLLEDDLIKKAGEILEVEQAPMERALQTLIDRELLIAETVEMEGMRDTAIYTPAIHTTEKAVAERVNTLLTSPWRSRPKPQELDAVMDSLTEFSMLSDEQKQAVRRSLSEPIMVLTGGPGVGKCANSRSLVLGNDGLRQLDAHWGTIEAAPDTFRRHKTAVVGKNRIANTSHAYYGGLRDTIKIGTHLGLELEGTPNHRVWAMTPTGPDWVRLDALQTGDYVAVRRGDDVWATGSVSPEIAYVLGAISGDGMQTRKDYLCITNNDTALLQRCGEALLSELGIPSIIRPRARSNDLHINGARHRQILHDLGVRVCKSDGKTVPEAIMRASRDAVLHYLAGLIDTDGHIQKRKTGQVAFEITLNSPRMIEQVQLLLLNLGIVSRRAIKTVNYRYGDRPVETRTYWRLTVSGGDADRLMEIIPTQKAVPVQERVCNTNRDIVPLPGAIIRDLFTATGKRARREWWAWKREIAEIRKPTRQRLLTLLEETGEENVPLAARNAIKEACRACYYWDEVKNLSPSSAVVYDLTVPGEESFIANGFVNHNTTTTRAIVAAFEKLGKRLQLASPTGRAAKRAAEVTGKEAKTIHRMLSFDPEKKGFKHGPGEPLELDVLVIDESSMLDLMLTHHTLRAVPDGAQVLFVGDVDQLPSVGPGSVLADLINSGRVPVARLTQVFRQAAQSQIITNAHAINRGKMPELLPPSAIKESQADCVFVEVEESDEMPDKLAGVVAKSLPKLGFNPDEITVLAPMQRGSVGARNLNDVLQRVLNPPRPDKMEHVRGPITFRTGDRVMQRVNNYDKNVFNGDVGLILSIDKENQLVGVQYPEGPVEYDFVDMDQLVHAFSLTVHKCIAEYEKVWTMGRGLVPIKDLNVGDWVETGREGARRVVDKVNTGEKKIVRLRTRYGFHIDVSEDHPVYAATNISPPSWIKAKDLTTAHFVCHYRRAIEGASCLRLPPIQKLAGRPNAILPTLPEFMNEDLAWLLGAIVGDGSCRDDVDGTVDFTNQDETVLTKFRTILEGYGLRVCEYAPAQSNAKRLYVVSRAFRRWLCELGLGFETGPSKKVPTVLWGASASCRAAFLRGLFDTDGSAGAGDCRLCRLVTSSKVLAEETQTFLLSLGIVSSVSNQGLRAFCVSVSGTAISDFARHIGFSVPYKQERLGKIQRLAGTCGKTNHDTIPFGKTVVEHAKTALANHFGTSRRVKGKDITASEANAIGRIFSLVSTGRNRLSYRHLNEICAYLMRIGVSVPPILYDVQNTNHFYDPLISVEETCESAVMYDIEVEGVHSFVAGGGFVCHNSQGSEYPACVIAIHTQHYMMLQRNLVYTALTRAKKIAVFVGSKRAIQMAVKNRNVVPRNTRLAQRLQMLVDNLGPGGLPKRPGRFSSSGPDSPAPPLPGRLF